MKALKMKHEVDPRVEVFERMGSPDAFEGITLVNPFEVVVAVYQRPKQTASGIHLSDAYREEDDYQGKVGLVLALGVQAFQNTETEKWPDRVPAVGDWVALRVSDAWDFLIGSQRCRVIDCRRVRFILQDPDLVY